jgi:hypothetical protein
MRESRDLRAVPSPASSMEAPDARQTDRPISSIIEDILRHVGEIIRSEVHLAKTEIKQDLQELKKAGTYLAIAGVTGMFALAFLLLAAVYALSTVMAPWLAAVIVGVVVGGVGAGLLVKGLHILKATSMTPDRTIQSLEDNVKWLKKHVE